MEFKCENRFSFRHGETKEAESEGVQQSGVKKSHRRTVECTGLSLKYEYRRAYSEVRLLESMRHVKLEKNVSYNFITGGDVDSLSYLKIILNQFERLDYLLFASWVICAEDLLQLIKWHDEGRLPKIDMYLGEIFPNQYKIEWGMIRDFYQVHPKVGRVAIFNNHAKIWGGYNVKNDFYFGVQGSGNATQNPRTEQACITTTRAIFDFYKTYFDGINSYNIR